MTSKGIEERKDPLEYKHNATASRYYMSADMDRAPEAMRLEDEDVPCDMSDLPQFSSAEDNVLNIIERVVNPVGVKMANLILDIPRKWQKVERDRGVALSNERFQFIFRSEDDLVEILEKGVHTYNERTLVMEHWVENPPSDFLQYIPLWVRIRRIPMNHYIIPTITWLGEMVG